MSDLCPQCGGPAYAPSNQCDVIWHTGAKPFGTSVVQDIEAQLAEQIEWVKSLADDLIAAEGREARLKEKLAKVVAAYRIEAMRWDGYSHDAFDKHIAELTGGKDDTDR